MANSNILYLELIKHDFRAFLKANPGYYRRLEDGKICFTPKAAEDPPWLYVKPTAWQNCNLWHRVVFDQFHNQEKVPIPCQKCWKVVLMPRNFEELVATWIMQRYLDLPCKCGTEGDRANTDRLYGAYFYCHSLEEGRRVHELVTKTIAGRAKWEMPFLGVNLSAEFGNELIPEDSNGTIPRIILKRGCTEYEQHCGPSDQWTWDEKQQEIEDIITESFHPDVLTPKANDNHVASILAGFIHKAFQWGDTSYKKFTNGNRLFSSPVTYHDKDDDFLTKFLKE